MRTLRRQRGVLDIEFLGSTPKPKEQPASLPKTPASRENTRPFNQFLAMLKTFGVWFFLGAGILFFGFLCVEAMREYATSSKADDHLFLFVVFVVAGGIFTGLLAIAILRASRPYAPALGGVLRGEALIEHANRLGVSLKSLYDSNGNLQEPELQRRVLDVEKAFRERWLLGVAVGAAAFSGFSALAAWMAHLK